MAQRFLLLCVAILATLSCYSQSSYHVAPAAYLKISDELWFRPRERMHNPSDHFTHIIHKPIMSYTAYSGYEPNAPMYPDWSAADFAHAIERAVDEAMHQGKSRADVEQELLSRHELYPIPAFQAQIKSFSGYRAHIKALHKHFAAHKGKKYKILKALGFLDPRYVQHLDLVEKWHAEIIQEEKEERRIAQQQALHAQQELASRQQAVRVAFDNQRASLLLLSAEWTQMQAIHRDYGLCSNERYERRQRAVDAITDGEYMYAVQSYHLSPQAKQLMRGNGVDLSDYQTCYGNQVQQAIHQECIDGLERLAALPVASIAYPYKESLAHCFDAACHYNQAGAVDKATIVADFCWSLLDYGKAIAEGAIAGAVSAVDDMIEHPGQALLCAVAGEYVFAYQLSKVLYNVADISVTYAFDPAQGQQKWDEYVAPVTQFIDAINNKELSLRDGIKGATQLAVQWKAQDKLLKGMNKFCKTAKAKAIEYAKNNPLASPEQYMTTPEGVMLQSAQNLSPSGSKFKYEQSSTFFIANQQEICALTKDAHTILQPSQEVLQILKRDSLNISEKFLKHIFAAELKEKKLPNGAIKKSLAGFHHYTLEHLKEMNIVLLNSRRCEKTGIIIADVLCDGHLEAQKTFFPLEWNRQQVISKS